MAPVTWCLDNVASFVIQTLPDPLMSRASIDRQPRLRTDDNTPDLDERSRKKVRWNSESVMEGDKKGDSEESTYDAKVGLSRLYVSTPHVT